MGDVINNTVNKLRHYTCPESKVSNSDIIEVDRDNVEP